MERAFGDRLMDRLAFVPPIVLVAALLYWAAGGPPLVGRSSADAPVAARAAASPTGSAPELAATAREPDRFASPVAGDAVTAPAIQTALPAPVTSDSAGETEQASPSAPLSSPGADEPDVPERHVPDELHDAAPEQAGLLETLLQNGLG